jgi:hypothetical protein
LDPDKVAEQPDTAAMMVTTWRRMTKKPQREGNRRRERVRNIQLEAAHKRM